MFESFIFAPRIGPGVRVDKKPIRNKIYNPQFSQAEILRVPEVFDA